MGRYLHCKWCGMPFAQNDEFGKQKYCSAECYAKDREFRREENINSSELSFARREMSKIQKGSLDKTLEKARKEGKTYAQVQMERTLELVRKGEL